MVEENIGAKLASMRKITTRTCASETCGKTFEGLGRRKYCDDKCKGDQKALLKRRRYQEAKNKK